MSRSPIFMPPWICVTRQSPLAQLAERPAVPAVAGEVVERVLVLGEDEQLHLRVVEDARVRSARP